MADHHRTARLGGGLSRPMATAGQGYGDQNYKRNGAAHNTEPTGIHSTDVGNGKRLVKRHGADLRYCHPWKKWLSWDGSRWQEDATATATYLASVRPEIGAA